MAVLMCLLCLQLRAQVIPFTSSPLPIVSLDTRGTLIADEPKIPVRLRVFDAAGRRNGLADSAAAYDGWAAVELRGNTSLYFAKAQFALELRDALGEDVETQLLGMPAEEDWVLSAAYSDKTLIRGILAFELARRMGRYASRTRPCELVIDGSYRGVYILTEKIKRDKRRVNIAELTQEDSAGDALTGGYIFKMDAGKGLPFEGWSASFDSAGYFSYFYHDPSPGRITTMQRYYLIDAFREFETAVRADDFADPTGGYRRYADASSFIDYLLMQELGNNVDGYSYSMYFHKDRDSRDRRVHMGPVWDFHSAFGNCCYSDGGSISGWRLHYERRPFWWGRMLQDTLFLRDLRLRWRELRGSVFDIASLHGIIDSLTLLLDEAKDRNFAKWNVLGRWIWPNSYVGNSYSDEIAFLKMWLRDRVLWIDEHIDSIAVVSSRGIDLVRYVIDDARYNRSTGIITVSCTLREFADARIDLFDPLGRLIVPGATSMIAAGRHEFTIPTGAAAAGACILRLSVAGRPVDSKSVMVVK
jgi:hypothetical protein